MKKVGLIMGQGQEIDNDEECENFPQLESATGHVVVDVGSHVKEGNGDGEGAVLHLVQGHDLGVIDLSQHEVASDSSALSETMVLASK